MRTFIEGHNKTADVRHIESCSSSTGIYYKYHGLLETLFWALTSMVVTSLNSYCIYLSNINNHQRTLYSILSDSLMASNIFAGAAIYPIFAYLSQNHVEDCILLICFMACCIHNLISTLLSIFLITINRFKILNSIRTMQVNRSSHYATRKKMYCTHFGIIFASLAITLIRIFFPAPGTMIVTTLSVSFTLIVIILLFIIHSKLKSISYDHGESSISGDSAIKPYKRSLNVLKLMILSMVLLWFPLVAVATIIRTFGLQNKALALSITLKLIWLRPVVDPIAYLAFVLKKSQSRRAAVVHPIALKGDYQIHNIQNKSNQDDVEV